VNVQNDLQMLIRLVESTKNTTKYSIGVRFTPVSHGNHTFAVFGTLGGEILI